jgi:PAS domain S-box-containing protein
MNLAPHNAACSTIFRLDEAAVGRNVRLVAGDEDLEEIFARVERCLLEGIETKDERIKAGRRRYNIQVKALSGENGGVTGAMVILVDMTEYLAALKNSRDKESILRSILSNTPAIVSLKNPSGRYGFVNSPFLRQFKLKRDQVLGKTDEEIFGERIATEIRSRDFEVLSRREPVTYEEEIELEGQKLILLTSKMPLLDSKFSPRSVCTISLDITKRRAAEEVIRDQREQLVRVNKLSALGEMAAGIAHEINTPLNTILANTELIELMCAKDPVARAEICESARKIGKTVTSISDIVTGLRQLARMDTHIGFAVHDLCQLLRDTVRVCELNLRNHGTRVEIKVPDCVVQVKCNPVQLSQVIINLINNAIDAVADRDDRWIEITVAERAKDVEVRVTDSGDGIPRELASKIMAPFFTTKAKDKGTGMGLSISQSIIRMHKGELVLDPNHDHTSFVILLPRAHSEKEAHSGEH